MYKKSTKSSKKPTVLKQPTVVLKKSITKTNITQKKDINIKKDIIPKNFNLGYACLNTVLREQNPPVFTSRTVRLDTLKGRGMEHVKALAMQNLQDLLTILEWNVEHDIYFMRVSSEIFPFASHPEHGYSIEFADALLKKVGAYAKKHGIRLTTHPGQYDVLSSPHDHVIHNTILDLNHHCNMLDRMGLGKDAIMIIHGGGVYGDKKGSLERLTKNFKKLPKKTQMRVVLENDEKNYTIEDLLPLCEKLKIPLVIDFHHDDINPSKRPANYYFNRVFAIWKFRGIRPKVHVSNSCEGVTQYCNVMKRSKHSDYVAFFHGPLLKIKFPIDVMLEAKMKEQAILRLRGLRK